MTPKRSAIEAGSMVRSIIQAELLEDLTERERADVVAALELEALRPVRAWNWRSQHRRAWNSGLTMQQAETDTKGQVL